MATQDQIDRAHEWTMERYPRLDGAEYDKRFAIALAEIVRIDRDVDAEEKRS